MNYSELLSTANFRTKLIKLSATSGTYSVGEKATFIQVFLCGAGGGGSGGWKEGDLYDELGGAGGGAGAAVKGLIFSPPPGTVFDYTVGAGGAGGVQPTSPSYLSYQPTDGSAGGNTTFTSSGVISIVCEGGAGGQAPYASSFYATQPDDDGIGGKAGEVIITDISDWSIGQYSWSQGLPQHYFRSGDGGSTSVLTPFDGGASEYYYNEVWNTLYAGGQTDGTPDSGCGGGSSLFGTGGAGGHTQAERDGGQGAGGAGGEGSGNSGRSDLWTGGTGGDGLIIIQEYYDTDPSSLFAITNY